MEPYFTQKLVFYYYHCLHWFLISRKYDSDKHNTTSLILLQYIYTYLAYSCSCFKVATIIGRRYTAGHELLSLFSVTAHPPSPYDCCDYDSIATLPQYLFAFILSEPKEQLQVNVRLLSVTGHRKQRQMGLSAYSVCVFSLCRHLYRVIRKGSFWKSPRAVYIELDMGEYNY